MRSKIWIFGIAALAMTVPGAAVAKDQGRSGKQGQKMKGGSANAGYANRARADFNRDRAYANRDLARLNRDRADRSSDAYRCPPGLAKKNNGCLPPGIAKQRFNAGDRLPTGYRANNIPSMFGDRYRDSDRSLYRYDDGSIYRADPTTRRILEVISPRLR